MSKQLSQAIIPGALDLASAGDDRRTTILAAALDRFMRYGFTRVTMDEVAGAAGISRPALYRDFRNKADIYAALAAVLLDRAADAAEAALDAPGPLAARLAAALDAGLLDLVTAISRSPHGAEILEAGDAATGDIVARWRARMTAMLAAAIAGEAEEKGIPLAARGVSAEGLAGTLLDGLDGAKHRSTDPDEWRAAAARLIVLVGLAIR